MDHAIIIACIVGVVQLVAIAASIFVSLRNGAKTDAARKEVEVVRIEVNHRLTEWKEMAEKLARLEGIAIEKASALAEKSQFEAGVQHEKMK